MGVGWLAILVVAALRGYFLLAGRLGSSSFPPPLSPEEEHKALAAFAKGDTEARNRLIEHNLRLVAHICKKFESVREDPEDIIQIGTVGLIKGIETFNAEKGTRLATYAARCIENEVLMHLRAMRKHRWEVFLEDPISSDTEGNEVTLLDILPDNSESIPDQVSRTQQAKHLLAIIRAHLAPRERRVVQLRFGIGGTERKTQREIARELRISRSYVSRIEKKALKRMKKEMRNDGE